MKFVWQQIPIMTPERLYNFVEDYFQRSGCTEFPRVRECARKLRISQADVHSLVDDHDDLMLTYWNAENKPKPGDWFVESL